MVAHGLSLAAAIGGYSLIAVHGLLIAGHSDDARTGGVEGGVILWYLP